MSHYINFATLGTMVLCKDGNTSQTTAANAYTSISFQLAEVDTSDLLSRVGNTIKNVSDYDLVLDVNGTVVAGGTLATLTIRIATDDPTPITPAFSEISSTRANSISGTLILKPGRSVTLQTYNQFTTNDPRNRLSATVKEIIKRP